MPKKEDSVQVSLLEKTLDDPPTIDEIGENTDRLSDVSEHEDYEGLVTTRKLHSTWYQRLRPLVRNPCVRAFTIVNLILIVINIIIFFCVLGFGVYALYHKVRSSVTLSKDRPCLYRWTGWSECSATCAVSDQDRPFMTRYVIPETVIQARGKYMKIAPCPADLLTMVDRAPCNTHTCPKKLSIFEMIGPFIKDYSYLDTEDQMPECYTIRNLERGDYLIEVDVPTLTVPAKCPQYLNKVMKYGGKPRTPKP